MIIAVNDQQQGDALLVPVGPAPQAFETPRPLLPKPRAFPYCQRFERARFAGRPRARLPMPPRAVFDTAQPEWDTRVGRRLAESGSFLVVEDDCIMSENLARLLSRLRRVVVAGTVSGARRELGSGERITGLVVDVGLPDGSGFEVVRLARERWPLVPVLVLTGCNEPPVINRSQQLRAEFLCKPARLGGILDFASRAVASESIAEERLSVLVAEMSRKQNFTPRETEVVVAALCRERSELAVILGVTENTLKTLVRSVLGKTGHDSLASLTRQLLSVALHGTGTTCPLQPGPEP